MSYKIKNGTIDKLSYVVIRIISNNTTVSIRDPEENPIAMIQPVMPRPKQ